MKAKLFFLLTILTVLCYLGIAYAGEEITLTTYYPAPYGEYEKLSVGVGAGYTAPTGGTDLIVEGNVGIGTTSPNYNLDVQGDINFTGNLFQNDDPFVTGYWTQSGNDVYYLDGNVGIGTMNPDDLLDVAGNIRATGFYDRDNTYYYVDPDGTSSFRNLTVGSNLTLQCNVDMGDYFLEAFDLKAKFFTDTDDTSFKVDPNLASTLYDVTMHDLIVLTLNYSSDESLKKNIQPISDALGKILKIDGVSFQWKENDEPGLGIIAQDLEKVFPGLVTTDKEGLKYIQYANLVAPLIEAVKEQQTQIQEQQLRIEKLELQIQDRP